MIYFTVIIYLIKKKINKNNLIINKKIQKKSIKLYKKRTKLNKNISYIIEGGDLLFGLLAPLSKKPNCCWLADVMSKD